MLQRWRALPKPLRKTFGTVTKAGLTVGAFYLLFTHSIPSPDGGRVSIGHAILDHLAELDVASFVPFILAAASIKLVGILCSMWRWHLLLRGQRIRFDFWHIVGSFLIGRFLGTFLPSTVGLDAYKLFDAARFSGRVVEPAAATAVEKVMGLSGIFLTFLVTLPFGYPILFDLVGERAPAVIAFTVTFSLAVVLGLFALLFRPGLVAGMLRLVPRFGRRKIEGLITRVSQASTAYRGKGGLLAAVIVLSFLVHFTTSAMYYFTARAVNAEGAEFWKVTFASSIQVFGTVMSPVTIAGEGIREWAQMVLLNKHIGASTAVLSAALGFWAAEALTLVGAFFWWARRGDYRPRLCEVDGVPAAAPVAGGVVPVPEPVTAGGGAA